MIGKELLSIILKVNVLTEVLDSDLKNNILVYWEFDGYHNNCRNINIYELYHKCKEWAFDNGYTIVEGIGELGEKVCYIQKITGFSLESYYEQTENYETSIKACQWILDKDSK